MVNWAQMYDCYFETGRVPELLGAVEREDDAEAWKELGYRLVLEHDLLTPASFAALPRLVRLASGSGRALRLAGEILERAAGHHGCDDLLADCAGAIEEFRESRFGLTTEELGWLNHPELPLAVPQAVVWADRTWAIRFAESRLRPADPYGILVINGTRPVDVEGLDDEE
ncbi:hypothetical protein [Streptomyces sp. IB2014 016-6]|uniref:hypothetical protein n=1 Tax=Streptomyces sp. IB2014 016-6 TaxID=2517818 RepID=UPI0011C99280|nr:hypothetical protein [Streptomyces sp. IB2014 016-6]TXL88116.1 hypothetical protein EW053_19905 [Streptomyces sp. IB2014 016-6]